ncbi:MAG: phosphoribosylformylglycinamidine synthase subunit PurQ, partial [Alphaproteobacteria bacterium]|nr:phosphoribosylformylglycinamidine synthase subunit PurQ [Alphaproteobacteria bacterium]
MKAAVLVFPGSNCDRDMAVALRKVGADVTMVWHKDAEIGDVDLVAVPGGFSFGDYLRCGAIAANSPVSQALKRHVERGGYALGVCNGFQVLTETGLLPGALMRNAALKFVCKSTPLTVA